MSEKEITDAYMKRHAFTDQLYARQKVTTTSNKRIIKTKRVQQNAKKQNQQLEEWTFKSTSNKQTTRTRDILTTYRVGSKPSNSTKEHNTEALQPVFMFGTARFHS